MREPREWTGIQVRFLDSIRRGFQAGRSLLGRLWHLWSVRIFFLLLAILALVSVPVVRYLHLFEKFDSISCLRTLPIHGKVRLRGIVTYSDPERLYIQDDTGAVSLEFKTPHRMYTAGQILVVAARKTKPYDPQLGPSSVALEECDADSSRLLATSQSERTIHPNASQSINQQYADSVAWHCASGRKKRRHVES